MTDGIKIIKSEIQSVKSEINGSQADSKLQSNNSLSKVYAKFIDMQNFKLEVLSVKSEMREFRSEIQCEFNKFKSVIDNLIK